MNNIIKFVNTAVSRMMPAKRLNVYRLKQFRGEANGRYSAYRNTRIGGYDVFETGNIFLGHYDNAVDAKSALDTLRRDYIMLLLDCTEKKLS